MSRSSRHGTRWLRGLAPLVLGAVLLAALVPAVAPAPANAQTIDELRREHADERARRERLDERRRAVERELRGTSERLGELQADLRLASERLRSAQDREKRANEAAAVAEHQANLAQQEMVRIDAARTGNAAQLAGLARDTYKYGAPRTSVASLLGSVTLGEQPGQLSDAVAFLERGVGQWTVLVEESEALLIEVEAWSARAEDEWRAREDALADAAEARDEAAEIHADIQDLVSEVSVQQHQQEHQLQQIVADREAVDQRVGALNVAIHAEARRLREEAERRRREAEERRQREAEQRRQREAEQRRQREAEQRRQREAEQQREAQRSRDAAPRPPAPSGGGGGTRVNDIGGGLVTVGGITVAASIGPNLKALLDAARADGIVLGGQGYRSVESQVALRIANGCRDVWTAPASSCRVPTAIPGRSEHEKGLAIDFTSQGRTICFPQRSSMCRGNRAFDWLQVNAGRYGFRNLPSEAWHWSTSGR